MSPTEGHRIVYAGLLLFPDGNAAAGRVLVNARMLRSLGHDVTLVGADRTRRQADVRRDAALSERLGFPVYLYGVAGIGRFLIKGSPLPVTRALRAMGPAPDETIVIAYNCGSFALAGLLLIRPFRHLRVVVDCTEWYFGGTSNPLRTLVRRIDTALRVRWLQPLCDGIVVTSDFFADLYRDAGKPVTVLPTLTPVEGAAGPGTDTGAGEPITGFVYAGNAFSPGHVSKGGENVKDRVDVTLRMFAALAAVRSDFALDVYGPTRDEVLHQFPELRDAVGALGERATFHGRVPRETIVAALRRADFTTFARFPTRSNLAGFPTKLAESIAFGCPVVTNPLPNIVPFVEEGATAFFFDVRDPGSQLALLTRLCDLGPDAVGALRRLCLADDLLEPEAFLPGLEAFLAKL